MSDPQAQLAQILAELKQNLAQPRADTLAFLAEATKQLRWIPLSVEPRLRVECLLSIAQQYIVNGQSL
ncbi:MAG: hypothetical protein ACM3ZD_01540, partial [Betaproteobacteria bacterium]